MTGNEYYYEFILHILPDLQNYFKLDVDEHTFDESKNTIKIDDPKNDTGGYDKPLAQWYVKGPYGFYFHLNYTQNNKGQDQWTINIFHNEFPTCIGSIDAAYIETYNTNDLKSTRRFKADVFDKAVIEGKAKKAMGKELEGLLDL